MILFDDKIISFHYDLCRQCGACMAVCPTGALSYTCNTDGLADISVDQNKCIKCGRCFKVCSANKQQDFTGYFRGIECKSYYLGYNADEAVRRESSSGGVCKTLIIGALRSGLVDGVYTLSALDKYPSAEGEFYTKENIPGFKEIPNSIYHSVLQCLQLKKVSRCKRLMIVGTSCQLLALEQALHGKYDSLIKVCIFCKQQKSLASTRFLAKISGTKISQPYNFTARYRGLGWPGEVSINGGMVPWHRAAQVPFGRRLWTVPGCDGCGDPFGFIAGADITLMDPWTIRTGNDLGETLTIASTPQGDELLRSIDTLVLEPKKYDEIVPALGLTDVKRKQALVPYFYGEKCSVRLRMAGGAERLQRAMLRGLVAGPAMPMIYYRALCKLPDLRNLILGKL